MILAAAQTFSLNHPAGHQAALGFVREPGRSLSRLTFLRDLQADGSEVRGVLAVTFPVLGEVTLPFVSRIEQMPDGAVLLPLPIADERAWVEVGGQATVAENSSEMHFEFNFQAHLAVPEAEGWGGAAFEKMVRAAAGRTLERIAAALPKGLAEAINAEA